MTKASSIPPLTLLFRIWIRVLRHLGPWECLLLNTSHGLSPLSADPGPVGPLVQVQGCLTGLGNNVPVILPAFLPVVAEISTVHTS